MSKCRNMSKHVETACKQRTRCKSQLRSCDLKSILGSANGHANGDMFSLVGFTSASTDCISQPAMSGYNYII